MLSSTSAFPLSSTLPPAGSLGFVTASADPVAALAVPVAAPAAPVALFRPVDVASAPRSLAQSLSGSRCLWHPLPLRCSPLCLRLAPLLRLAPSASDAPRGASFRPFVPGPSASAGPPQSSFAFTADEPFDPGLANPSASEPEVPIPSSVPDSVRAEIRRMYAYLVDLFPQTAGSPSDPPPPRALFEDFFAASTSHLQPVFLAWFEQVCTALAEADAQLTSVLASGRVDASILPQRVS